MPASARPPTIRTARDVGIGLAVGLVLGILLSGAGGDRSLPSREPAAPGDSDPPRRKAPSAARDSGAGGEPGAAFRSGEGTVGEPGPDEAGARSGETRDPASRGGRPPDRPPEADLSREALLDRVLASTRPGAGTEAFVSASRAHHELRKRLRRRSAAPLAPDVCLPLLESTDERVRWMGLLLAFYARPFPGERLLGMLPGEESPRLRGLIADYLVQHADEFPSAVEVARRMAEDPAEAARARSNAISALGAIPERGADTALRLIRSGDYPPGKLEDLVDILVAAGRLGDALGPDAPLELYALLEERDRLPAATAAGVDAASLAAPGPFDLLVAAGREAEVDAVLTDPAAPAEWRSLALAALLASPRTRPRAVETTATLIRDTAGTKPVLRIRLLSTLQLELGVPSDDPLRERLRALAAEVARSDPSSFVRDRAADVRDSE